MANEKETAQAEEAVLDPMVMKPSFDFKKAIAKAKKNAVDCGIFAYIAEQKKKVKK